MAKTASDQLIEAVAEWGVAHTKIEPKQAKAFAEALMKGQPEGPRLALTACRDKLTQMQPEGPGPVSALRDKLGQTLS